MHLCHVLHYARQHEKPVHYCWRPLVDVTMQYLLLCTSRLVWGKGEIVVTNNKQRIAK